MSTQESHWRGGTGEPLLDGALAAGPVRPSRRSWRIFRRGDGGPTPEADEPCSRRSPAARPASPCSSPTPIWRFPNAGWTTSVCKGSGKRWPPSPPTISARRCSPDSPAWAGCSAIWRADLRRGRGSGHGGGERPSARPGGVSGPLKIRADLRAGRLRPLLPGAPARRGGPPGDGARDRAPGGNRPPRGRGARSPGSPPSWGVCPPSHRESYPNGYFNLGALARHSRSDRLPGL